MQTRRFKGLQQPDLYRQYADVAHVKKVIGINADRNQKIDRKSCYSET